MFEIDPIKLQLQSPLKPIQVINPKPEIIKAKQQISKLFKQQLQTKISKVSSKLSMSGNIKTPSFFESFGVSSNDGNVEVFDLLNVEP